MKSAFRWLLGLIVVLVVVALGVYGPFQRYTAQRRDAAVARLRTITASRPAPSENTASNEAPVGAAASDSNAAAQEAFERLGRQSGEFWNSDDACVDLCSRFGSRKETLTTEEIAQLETCLKQVSGLIQEIRRFSEAARPALESKHGQDFDEQVHYSWKFGEFARLIRATARLNTMNNRISDSLEDVDALIRFSDALAREPQYFYQSRHRDIWGRVFEAANDVMNSSAITDDGLAGLAARLPGGYGRDVYAESLTNQASGLISEYEHMRETGEGLDGIIQGAQLGAFAGSTLSGRPMPGPLTQFTQSLAIRAYYSPLGRPWQNLDQQAYADGMANVAAVALLPYFQAVPDPVEFDRANSSRRFPLAGINPSVELAGQAVYEAEVDLMRMAIPLQRYRLSHGEYPPSLDAAASEIGGALPLDPFSGASYIYRPSGDSFLLYSVSYNRQDDGGTEGLHYDGDIVWRIGK